jgi:hypothetical protein
MVWYLYGGKPLYRPEYGGMSTDIDCCCDGKPPPPVYECCCPEFADCLESSWGVAISGAIEGQGTIQQTSVQPGECIRWEGFVTMETGQDCGGEFIDLFVAIYCPEDGTSAEDLVVEINGGGGLCAVGQIFITEATCGPPASITGFTDVVEAFPVCPCAGETISFTLTFNEDCGGPEARSIPPAAMEVGRTVRGTATPKQTITRRHALKQGGPQSLANPRKTLTPDEFLKNLPPELRDSEGIKKWLKENPEDPEKS